MRGWEKVDQIDSRVMRAAREARKPGTHLEIVGPECVRIVNDGPDVEHPRQTSSRVGTGRGFAGDRGTDRY